MLALDATSLAVSVFLKFGLVIALIYGTLYLLRHWNGFARGFRAAPKQLAVLETSRLSSRQALHLVRAGEQVWLIGATDQAVTLLTEVEPQTATESGTDPDQSGPARTPQPSGFAGTLAGLLRKNGNDS